MKYLALATDYDGTLASNGRIEAAPLAAIQRLRQGGVKLILVTGRHLLDLLNIFPQLEVFHRVVAENGALLYRPEEREEILLGAPPPVKFMRRLYKSGVTFSLGRVIVATELPHLDLVTSLIAEMGLNLRVILNKGAVMLLPAGVHKGSGLLAALHELNIAAESTLAVGDGENDLDFLEVCGYSAAVANALPTLKKRVDLVTEKESGAGVMEVIERLNEGL